MTLKKRFLNVRFLNGRFLNDEIWLRAGKGDGIMNMTYANGVVYGLREKRSDSYGKICDQVRALRDEV